MSTKPDAISMTFHRLSELGSTLMHAEQLSDPADRLAAPSTAGHQALELAFLIAERMRSRTGLPPLNLEC